MRRFLIDNSHATLVCRAHALSVGTKSLAYHAVALQRLLWTGIKLVIAQLHVDAAAWYVNHYYVAILYLANVAA